LSRRRTPSYAQPEDHYRDQQVGVTSAWQDREGEHEDTRVVSVSPYTYTLNVAPVLTEPAENPKYMRYVRMRLA